MKLLVERIEDVQYLVEEKDGRKNLYIEGVYLQAGIKNRNGRLYPEHIMEKEVARYIKEKVERKTAYGELGHPEGPSINPDRISHRIVELHAEGKNWLGKSVIIPEGKGKIAAGIIETGGTLGVSSRAMGSLKEENGIKVVQEDFRLSTAADIVTDPSAPDAYVNGIYESVDWVWDEKHGWKTLELVEQHKKELDASTLRQIQERKLALFEAFLRTL